MYVLGSQQLMSCWPGAQLALASAIPLFCWYLLLNSWEMWSLTGHVFISQVMRKIIFSLIAFQELLWICFVMFCHAELLLFFYFRVSLNLSRLPSSKTLSLCKICLWQMLLIIFFFFFATRTDLWSCWSLRSDRVNTSISRTLVVLRLS